MKQTQIRTLMLRMWLILWCGVWSVEIFGCAASKPSPPPPSVVAQATIPPEIKGGRLRMVVLRLENKTRLGKLDDSGEDDQLFGSGMRTQLMTVFEQTGQFIIRENSGPRKVLWSRAITPAGEIPKEVRERIGSLGDAELMVAGAITAYQLSQESKAAGISADLLFRESQAGAINVSAETAKKIFERLPILGNDRVAMELWLIEAKTGKRIASTTIEGTSNDSGEAIGGLFGSYLATSSSSRTQTPMQRALRGCAIKAVNWIADSGVAYREGSLVIHQGSAKSSSQEPKLRPSAGAAVKSPTTKTPSSQESSGNHRSEEKQLSPTEDVSPSIGNEPPSNAVEPQNDDKTPKEWGH